MSVDIFPCILRISNILLALYIQESGMRADLVILLVVALVVRAACDRLKPQHSIRSYGVVLKCLFDDRNVLCEPIYDMTSSCYLAMSY